MPNRVEVVVGVAFFDYSTSQGVFFFFKKIMKAIKKSSTHPSPDHTTSYVKTQAMTVTNRSKEAKVKDDSKDGTINDAGQLVSAPGEYATPFHFRFWFCLC